MYNIYGIHTDTLLVKGMILNVYLYMLLATHCMYFYWLIVCAVLIDVYIGCMWIVSGYGCNVDNVQCL